MKQTKGINLHPDDKRHVLSSFVDRFTGDHIPAWPSGNYRKYPHFANDDDWLNNSLFFTRSDGRLDRRFKHCESSPTWPLGRVR